MRVDRNLRVLEALAARSGPAGVIELSGALDEPAPSLHRTLKTLMSHGLVIQHPETKRYQLGPAILSLADAYREQNRLVVVAQPVLDALRSELHESVFVCELVDERAVVVAVAESTRPLRAFMRLGRHMPFHAAASARAILAFQEPSHIQRLLELDGVSRYTGRTRMGTDELLAALDFARRHGYAVCDQEMEVGVKAIARPIRDDTSTVVASVAVVAPRERLSGRGRQLALRALAVAAANISSRLGGPSPAAGAQSLTTSAGGEVPLTPIGDLDEPR